MDYRKIAESIKNRIEKTHDREAYKDLLALCIGYEAEDFDAAHQLNSEVRKMTSEALRNGTPKDAEYFYTLHKQSMLFDAPHDFDTFLLYVEMDRKPEFQSTPPPREGGDMCCDVKPNVIPEISIHAPREGGDSKDAQFYLRIFDKQVELLRFLGKIRGGCLRNPEKNRRFLGKSLANLPAISGHLDFAGGGKARPGYPCAVPLLRRAACVRGSGDPLADRCSSYRNAPLFSHIASPDSKSADCLSQNP